jgi:hypothetical protein
MSQLLRTEAVDIGGKTFTIKILPFKESRKLAPIVQRAMGSFDPELGEQASLLLAGILGQITDADIDAMVKAFGASTTVDFQDGTDENPSRVLVLSRDEALNEVFTGCIEDMYVWLDACVKMHFEGLISKAQAAISAVAGKAKAKRAAAEKEAA